MMINRTSMNRRECFTFERLNFCVICENIERVRNKHSCVQLYAQIDMEAHCDDTGD